MTGLLQPWLGCSISAKTTPPRPTTHRIAPTTSTRRPSVPLRWDSGQDQADMTTTRGTLIAKIQRQET